MEERAATPEASNILSIGSHAVGVALSTRRHGRCPRELVLQILDLGRSRERAGGGIGRTQERVCQLPRLYTLSFSVVVTLACGRGFRSTRADYERWRRQSCPSTPVSACLAGRTASFFGLIRLTMPRWWVLGVPSARRACDSLKGIGAWRAPWT